MPQFQYKQQQFQQDAVKSVADMFRGMDIHRFQQLSDFSLVGKGETPISSYAQTRPIDFMEAAYMGSLNENLREIQRRNNILLSDAVDIQGGDLVLDTQMETGTGKTFTFINTVFELNKRHGLTHFIIIVPSIAIKEGIKKAFDTTQLYFQREYGKGVDVHEMMASKAKKGRKALPSGVMEFIHSGKLTVLITTSHSFNSDKNIVNQQIEGFYSDNGRTPMDAIAARHPVLIIDEPQRVEGPKTAARIQHFSPLFVLRYSATFREGQMKNPVYILDSYDAFSKKLVKNIAVADYEVKATDSEFIGVRSMSHKGVELEAVKTNGTLAHIATGVEKEGSTGKLFSATKNPAYRDLRVVQINQRDKSITLSDGRTLRLGEYAGKIVENDNLIAEVMLRDMISKHLEKERVLFAQGIKCLSLVFIDKVKDYRDYESDDSKGHLQGLFEKCYQHCVQKLQKSETLSEEYRQYLNQWQAAEIHGGYFSADSNRNKQIDAGTVDKKNDTSRNLQQEITDLILRDKENILQPNNKLRFIFAHSALREGWDNPNVFQICKLRSSYSEISIVQEVGRGLRICVDSDLKRQDEETVGNQFSTLNRLDVFTLGNGQFIDKLQKELSERRNAFNAATKHVSPEELRNIFKIDFAQAIEVWSALHKGDCIDREGFLILSTSVESILKEHGLDAKKFFAVFSIAQKPTIENSRDSDGGVRTYKVSRDHYEKFKELWMLLHQKVIYEVRYDENFISDAAAKINAITDIIPLRVTVTLGELGQQDGDFGHTAHESSLEQNEPLVSDISLQAFLRNLAEKTNLPKNTIIGILHQVDDAQYKRMQKNPFLAIEKVTDAINSVIYSNIIDRIRYRKIDGLRGSETTITLTNASPFDARRYIELNKLQGYKNNNLWEEIAPYDSEDPERKISENSLTDEKIVVFAKIPKVVNIPAPLYPKGINPDFGFVVQKDNDSCFYFVAEAKPTTDTDELRPEEARRVDFMKKYFQGIDTNIKFEVISSYQQLLGYFQEIRSDQ